MKQEFQDHIDDYLSGRMSDEDRMSFEKELKQDAELREQMEFTQNVQTATKSRNEKLAKMDEWEDDYVFEDDKIVASANYRPTGSGYESCSISSDNQSFAKPYYSFRNYFYWISGMAAIFITVFFMFSTFNDDKKELLYSPMQIEDGTMRGGSDYADIEKLLINKEYNQALSLIEKKENIIQEWLAITESIDDAEQREYEKRVLKIDLDHLYWFKIYALFGLNEREKALVLLNRLREKDGLFKERADSLYDIVK